MLDRLNVWVGALVARAQNLKNESGQTLVEYSLVLALVAVFVIAALIAIGGDVNTIFGKVQAAMDSAVSAIP